MPTETADLATVWDEVRVAANRSGGWRWLAPVLWRPMIDSNRVLSRASPTGPTLADLLAAAPVRRLRLLLPRRMRSGFRGRDFLRRSAPGFPGPRSPFHIPARERSAAPAAKPEPVREMTATEHKHGRRLVLSAGAPSSGTGCFHLGGALADKDPRGMADKWIKMERWSSRQVHSSWGFARTGPRSGLSVLLGLCSALSGPVVRPRWTRCGA